MGSQRSKKEAGRPKGGPRGGQEEKIQKNMIWGGLFSVPGNLRRAVGDTCFLTPLLWFCYIYPFYDARIIELLFAKKTEHLTCKCDETTIGVIKSKEKYL